MARVTLPLLTMVPFPFVTTLQTLLPPSRVRIKGIFVFVGSRPTSILVFARFNPLRSLISVLLLTPAPAQPLTLPILKGHRCLCPFAHSPSWSISQNKHVFPHNRIHQKEHATTPLEARRYENKRRIVCSFCGYRSSFYWW